MLTEMCMADARSGRSRYCWSIRTTWTCDLLDVPRHAGAEAKIVNEAKRFWATSATGSSRRLILPATALCLKLLFPREQPGSALDLTGNNEIPDLLLRRAAMCAEMARLKKRCEIIENKLRVIMGDHATVTGIEDFLISYKTQKRKGYVVEPSEPRVLLIKDKRPADHAATSR